MMVAFLFAIGVILSPRPTVAVVEYRSGVSEEAGFATRLAKILAAKSGARVMLPSTVRMAYGGSFYDDVLKCESEPKCLARIGRKVGADELLYVTIGRIDNIFISVMRISTSTGKEISAYTLELPPGHRVSKIQMVVILRKLYPPSFFVRYGAIRIYSNVKGAEVFINGKRVGVTPLDKQVLPAGRRYTIDVRKEGYTSFTMTLRLPPEGDMKVDAHLSRKVVVVQTKATPWYKRWWVWAGAAAVVAGAGTLTYFLTRPTEAEGWVKVE